MNEDFRITASEEYSNAERRALGYFTSLYNQVIDRSYITALTEDLQLWKRNHLQRFNGLSLFSRAGRKPDTRDFYRYIQWLKATGKLNEYLNRSISYMYMRDLGKDLNAPQAQRRIQRMADDMSRMLLKPPSRSGAARPEFMNLAEVYRWAQKEGIEEAIIWLFRKLRAVAAHIPEGMSAEHAQRKLIKIIIGVVLHVMEEMDDQTAPEERSRRLDASLRIGYSYGLTYPFVDDLLDSQILTPSEQERYSALIEAALLTGEVPGLGEWSGQNLQLIQYIHKELTEAFVYIREYQREENRQVFFAQSYVFFQAQDVDRVKLLTQAGYTNEELYIPVILKSSSSRLIARSVIDAQPDDGFAERTFFFGIYNQLADDFADMEQDLRDGAVTPYTYYMQYHQQRPDLINPFEVYWAVVSNLIHTVYRSDSKAREVILDRAVNGLKRYKERAGAVKYKETMMLFAGGMPEFNRILQKMVSKAVDVDFLTSCCVTD